MTTIKDVATMKLGGDGNSKTEQQRRRSVITKLKDDGDDNQRHDNDN